MSLLDVLAFAATAFNLAIACALRDLCLAAAWLTALCFLSMRFAA